MTTPICSSPTCDRPPHDGHLCQSCINTLRRDLEAIPDLLADIMVTISRQDRLSDSDGRGSSEKPLPLRLGPMEAKRDLADTITAWSDHVAARRDTNLTGQTTLQRADWLTLYLGEVQDDPRAGDLADEIGYAVITAQRAVDKPLIHQYVGPCDLCGSDLYAHPRSKVVACRNQPCDAEYNVEDRRAWLLSKAEDQLMTATEISRALPNLLQRSLTSATIRGWARHGKITQHPPLPDRPRDPVYRIGDVLSILNAIQRGGQKAC